MPTSTPRRGAVVAHPHPLYGGTMHNGVVTTVRDALLDHQAVVLRFNFRGTGRSEGRHDAGRGEVGDLAAALARLAEEARDLPVLLAGYSFGAAMALGVLQERTVDALLLLAPPLEHYDFSPLAATACPVGVVWGERDALTPRHLVERLPCSDGGLELRCVEGAAHDLGAAPGKPPLRAHLDTLLGALLDA